MRLFRKVHDGTTRLLLIAGVSAGLMTAGPMNSAMADNGVQKFGKALCKPGKKGYTAVLKNGKSYLSVKSKLGRLDAVKDKKKQEISGFNSCLQ